jgi:ferredoxin
MDFASKQEAQAALEATAGTHLYGRRLVVEWAEQVCALSLVCAQALAPCSGKRVLPHAAVWCVANGQGHLCLAHQSCIASSPELLRLQDAGLDEMRAKTAAKFHDDFGDEAAEAAGTRDGRKQRKEPDSEADADPPSKKRKKRKASAA